MTIKVLDTVALARDLPEHKLKQGDLGAVVEVYAPNGLEVEFVKGSGHTQALVTLKTSDVRAVLTKPVVSISANVMGGAPVFPGTRVPVQTLVEYIEAGDTIDEFLKGFPTVKRDDIVAFLKHDADFRSSRTAK